MGDRYDRAITVFSPDGHLFQVDYAREAVSKGAVAVAIVGKNVVVLAVEKKAVAKLQEERTNRKIAEVDDHIALSFAGLTADARVLVNRARVECQSHRLTVEDSCSVEYITRFIAQLKQKYTQSNGRRPFGLAMLIAGFDEGSGEPRLFQTDPSGAYNEWRANAIGRQAKTVREFLERSYFETDLADDNAVMRLAVRALVEVVQSSARNIEVAAMRRGKRLGFLTTAEVELLLTDIERERQQQQQQAAGSKGKSG